MEPTIIQLAIDSFWNTIQSKELYMIVVVILVLYAMKPWKKKQNEEVYGQQEQEELNASYKQSLANKKERDKK